METCQLVIGSDCVKEMILLPGQDKSQANLHFYIASQLMKKKSKFEFVTLNR